MLAEHPQLCFAPAIPLNVAGNVSETNVARLMGATICEGQDMVNAGPCPLDGMTADLAASTIAQVDLIHVNRSNGSSATPGTADCVVLLNPSRVVPLPTCLRNPRLLWMGACICCDPSDHIGAISRIPLAVRICEAITMFGLILARLLIQPWLVRKMPRMLVAACAQNLVHIYRWCAAFVARWVGSDILARHRTLLRVVSGRGMFAASPRPLHAHFSMEVLSWQY